MTFLEAALEILKRERKPLHYKELTERAMEKKLLTFVGRTPEVTMQTQLTNAVKKAPGNPFVRVKPGVFGLLRYPEVALDAMVEVKESAATVSAVAADGERDARGRRRRRGGRGKGRRGEARPGAVEATAGAEVVRAGGDMISDENDSGDDLAEGQDNGPEGPDEPEIGHLSPEARAAALAETGVLESEEEGPGEDEGAEAAGEGEGEAASARPDDDDDDDDELAAAPGGEDAQAAEGDEGDDEEDDDEPGAEAPGAAVAGAEGRAFDEAGGRRRRRRRRRRRGGENGMPEAFGSEGVGASPSVQSESTVMGESGESRPQAEATTGEVPAATPGESTEAAAQSGRRIMAPIDAAIEILKGQAPGRGVHVRQIADAAVRRRLIHGEPNEAWRVMRAALAAEPRERLRAGLRPRVRPAGSGLYALSRRPPDMDLERAEYVFGEARRALRERILAALEQRMAELSPSAFEAIARVLLQREGFGPATFVKRVEGTVYLESLRGRGSRPSRCLIGLRPGTASAGRRAIGELRAGIRARNQDEGLLLLAGRLGEDAIAEWRQPGAPIEVVDGPAMADTCVRHGVGVVNAMVSVDFVDADFFAEISEG
jgi:hypothetical protein